MQAVSDPRKPLKGALVRPLEDPLYKHEVARVRRETKDETLQRLVYLIGVGLGVESEKVRADPGPLRLLDSNRYIRGSNVAAVNPAIVIRNNLCISHYPYLTH